MDWKKKLKFIVIVAAFAALILIVLSNVFKMTQLSEKDYKIYKQGVYYLEKKDYENAYFNFSNVSKTSAIYEIALLRQALSADALNDSSIATKKYKMFIEKYPDSIFVQKAYYALGQNHFKEKDFNKAEKTFNEIKKLFKDSDYRTAADYYLGLICLEKIKSETDEKRIFELKLRAKKYFMTYLSLASGGRFSLDCANRIQDLGIPLSNDEYFFLGEAYYKNCLYKESLLAFENANIKFSWAYLSLLNKLLGHYSKSREIFDINYPKYNHNIDEEVLYKVIDNYVQISRQDAKMTLYKLLEISHSSAADGEDYILYSLSKYVKDSEKSSIYRKIFTKFAQGKFASDALANLFWEAYQRRDYKEAKMLGTIHIRDYQSTIAAPKILFWMAKLSEKQGLRNEARGFYQKLLEKYPDDYYAYRAENNLNYAQSVSWKTKTTHKLSERKFDIEFPSKHANISDDNIKLLENILKLNDYKLLAEIDKNDKVVQSWINYKEGNYSTSAILARDSITEMQSKPDFTDIIYKLAYQLHYQDFINQQSKIYQLDPYLIVALIREESYFNPDAGSSVGARGLMQLMPATASYIAGRNGLVYNGLSTLLNPETNIQLGCAYLRYAKEVLSNDDLLAVASYNGGPNVVKTWKNNLNYKNFDEFIENIPYPETKEYIKKVFRSYWMYLNIY